MGRIALGMSSFCLITGVTLSAAAQQAVPAPSPPPAAAVAPAPAPAPLAAPPPAPPGAAPLAYPGYPPPPPPSYGYQQQSYDGRPRRWSGDDSVPYEGGPVPSGYHVESRPRRGLLVAGPILLGVPYALGLSIAGGQNFPNSTGWLILPGIGPWLALAARHKSGCGSSSTSNGIDYSSCDDSGTDDATRTSLILDGLMQTSGAIMFIVGLASPKKVIARDFVGSLHFAPSTMGRSGYGGFVWAEF